MGAVSYTDIQGVSALLVGSVDPGGEATSYRYEYVSQAGFEASGFAGAAATQSTPAGSGSGSFPARAAIAGLATDTAYRFRLVASNASGTATSPPASFTTTHGFGFLPGSEGFGVGVFADGGKAATKIGSHPYQLSIGRGCYRGG